VDWALAVDYGTIVTAAAVRSGDHVEILEIDGDRFLPSPVGVDDDGEFVTGRDAIALARWNADQVERFPKRALIAGAAVRLGDRPVDPIDLVAATLRRVADEALRRFDGRPPSRVVLSHPARWTGAETDRLLAAATRAGLTGLELVPEPVAAATHHALIRPVAVGGHVAVYDMGGEALDTAVLRRTPTSFVLCGAGHRAFGGAAVDEALHEIVAGHARGADPEAWDAIWDGPGIRRQVMRERLLEAKAALTSRPWAAVEVHGIDSGVRVTRRELERAVEGDLVATVDELLRTVRDAGVEPPALDAVLVTGGASRMPRIADLVHERTGQAVEVDDDPESAVALGALALLPVMDATAPVGAAGAGTALADPVDAPPSPDIAAMAQPGTGAVDAEPLAADAPSAATNDEADIAPAAAARPSHRLRPVLVGVGMAAVVAGVVTPIAMTSGSANVSPATIPPPIVVVATGGTTTTRTAPPTTTPAVPTAATSRPASPTTAREKPNLDGPHLALFQALSDVGGVRWGSCSAYPEAETATYTAAIQCSPSSPSLDRNVVFYRLADDRAYSAMYKTGTDQVSGSGSCDGGGEAATTWTDGRTTKGFLVCYDDPDTGNFRMAWASSEALVGAVISDPSAATAYTWWKAHAATLP
jgi:hypothetical protein